MVIYELDERGRRLRGGQLFYDATMGDADDTFTLLAARLKELDADKARLWVYGGDGAEWIWNRLDWLVNEVGFARSKVVEVLDFYHGTEYLSEFADERTRWTARERSAWLERMKRHLRKGNIEAIVDEMNVLCFGRRARAMGKVIRRFEEHAERMRYAALRRRGLPCGSGAIESAVRRIVNLRLKGNGIFWLKE